MTHNPTQDIEQLLQQYADDRRTQQAAANRLRAADRRHRHTRRTVFATLLLLLAGGGAPLLLKPYTLSPTPVSRNGNAEVCECANMSSIDIPVADPETHPQANPPIRKNSLFKHTEKFEPLKTATADAMAHPESTPQQLNTLTQPDNTGDTRNTQIINPNRKEEILEGITDGLADQTLSNPHINTPKRHAFVATIGASTPLNARGDATPILTASIGLNIALASSPNYEVNIGIGAFGYIDAPLPQSKDNNHAFSPDHSNGIDSWTSMQNESMDAFGWYYPAFGLYATLPLTFDLYPHGRDKTGIQLTLAPGHTLTPVTTHAGNAILHGLNPWKLTAGLGLTLPQGALSGISFTTDLLPSYLRGPLEGIHQVGITLAF